MNKELLDLYHKTSKHSSYQTLAPSIQKLINIPVNQTINRFEEERMDFLNKNLSFTDKKVLDIGGNTGYFSFQSLEAGANEVLYIEGNSAHASFVSKAAELLNKNIKSQNRYLDFKSDLDEVPFDIVLCFNVIHHLGDDFGDGTITMDKAKVEMQNAVNYFHDKTDILVLQMGFCWKGNRNLLLFENGTKSEMIDFIKDSTKDLWDIVAIGVAEEDETDTIYKAIDESNIQRFDHLGEFRNRPIFILKSKG